ncbi:MAG: hypothetical protein JWM63_874, partial [Gammaproteobacteria bacterium]|nr:hypothetical protein [Gammaproteobacteria bacterium]
MPNVLFCTDALLALVRDRPAAFTTQPI